MLACLDNIKLISLTLRDLLLSDWDNLLARSCIFSSRDVQFDCIALDRDDVDPDLDDLVDDLVPDRLEVKMDCKSEVMLRLSKVLDPLPCMSFMLFSDSALPLLQMSRLFPIVMLCITVEIIVIFIYNCETSAG